MEEKRKTDLVYAKAIYNQIFARCQSRCMLSVFLYALLRSLVSAFGIAFCMTAYSMKSDFSVGIYVFVLLFLFVSIVVSELLTYGLFSLLSSFTLKKNASMYQIFDGFRDSSSRALKASLIFSGINAVVSAFFIVFFLIFDKQYQMLKEVMEFSSFTLLISVVYIAVLLICVLPFIFVYPILNANKEISVKNSFKVSWKLIKNELFRFIGFVIKRGGFDLILAIVLNGILFFIPVKQDSVEPVSLAASIINFVALMCEFRAITRLLLAISVFFYTAVGVLHSHKESEVEHVDIVIGSGNLPVDSDDAVGDDSEVDKE